MQRITKIFSLVFLTYAFLPAVVLAQRVFEFENSASAGGGGRSAALTVFIDIVEALLGLSFLFAIMFIIIGAFRFMVAAGNVDAAKQGNQTINNALIGIAIIIVAYAILTVYTESFNTEPLNITY
jgi:hypothetical protein